MPSGKIIFWAVDLQADFMLAGGKLYAPGAEEILPNVRRLISAAKAMGVLVVSSGDAHTENDPEFQTFPPHCVSGTAGARILPEALVENFRTIPNDPSQKLPQGVLRAPQIVFEKQTLDVFENPHAGELVERLGTDASYVVFGVVTEYCVRLAAKGLLQRGRRVAVVTDAVQTLKPEDGRRTLEELRRMGARLITTDEALSELSESRAVAN